jgi:hypothetical protein
MNSKNEKPFKAECPYCGKEFQEETEIKASTKEGRHRTKEHIQPGQTIDKKTKGNNLIDDWKTQEA